MSTEKPMDAEEKEDQPFNCEPAIIPTGLDPHSAFKGTTKKGG